MRGRLFFFLWIIISLSIKAQVPFGFSYQAVLRNTNGDIMANQSASIRISLVSGDNKYFSETHSVQSSSAGLVNLIIGKGINQTGNISDVPWVSMPISLKLELKVGENSTYKDMGVQPLQSVPYAMYAASGLQGPQGPAGNDGFSIQWLGDFASHPFPAIRNQAYYNSQYKKSYIYDGDSWEIMAQDGMPGQPGTGLVLRGSWSESSTYSSGDYVFDQSSSNPSVNSMWICQSGIGPINTHPKDDTTHWVEFQAPAGPQGLPGQPGISIDWLGEKNTHPLSPVQNQAYYNTSEKKTYIFDDGNWHIMVQDGKDGLNGMIVPGVLGQTLVHSGSQWIATGKISVIADTVGIGLLTPISKLVVQGDATALPEDPIFEVRNKDGKVVLGVYNEGVRVYVADGSVKGAKGGFAVGGLSTQGKAMAVEYLRITPDSARIYIDTSSTKGAKGGFAVGGLSTQGKVGSYELFRVTKDSTRVYVAEGSAKGAKGGFAVGGLSTQGKAGKYDMLRVTKDSTRVYINDIGKGAKGGFAVGGLSTQGKALPANFFDIETDASGTIVNSRNKVLWYPLKNAFLVGRVLIESPDSVGVNSFSTGYESKAIGVYSQAMGFKAKSKGDYSTAIGKHAMAIAPNSYAFGDSVIASSENSYVFGKKSVASGIGSFAFGYRNISKGDNTVAIGSDASANYLGAVSIGQGTVATSKNSLAVGFESIADNESAVAMGSKSFAKGWASFTVGWENKAYGDFSVALGGYCETGAPSTYATYAIAMGNTSKALANRTIALGDRNIASAEYAVAIGSQNTASSNNAIAIGTGSSATGYWSIALGYSTLSSGPASLAMGLSTISKGYATTSMGFNTKAKSFASLVIGQFNDTSCISSSSWNSLDPVFVIGNGASDNARNNALTVYKDGSIDIDGAVSKPIMTVSSNTTLGNSHYTVLVNAAATISLPLASTCIGRIYIVKNISTGTVTIDASGTEKIDDTETKQITQWNKLIVQSNGNGWYIIN